MAGGPPVALLVQRRVGLRAELGGEVSLLRGRNLAGTPGNRLGRQAVSLGELPEVAIDGAHADAEDPRGLGFTGAGPNRLNQMTAQIQGVGTHDLHLHRPLPHSATKSTLPQDALGVVKKGISFSMRREASRT